MENIFLFIIIGVVGVWLGSRLARGRMGCVVTEQSKQKAENKEEILEFLGARLRKGEEAKITNDDVEELTGMSDATAERYLDELEKEGKLTQHGEIGQGVFYTLK